LAELQPCQRLFIGTYASAAVARSTRLDLGEHEHLAIERDHVDLAVTCPHIAFDHHEPETAQVTSSKVLAECAQRPPTILWRWGSGRNWA
jgi:hypothetical protein